MAPVQKKSSVYKNSHDQRSKYENFLLNLFDLFSKAAHNLDEIEEEYELDEQEKLACDHAHDLAMNLAYSLLRMMPDHCQPRLPADVLRRLIEVLMNEGEPTEFEPEDIGASVALDVSNLAWKAASDLARGVGYTFSEAEEQRRKAVHSLHSLYSLHSGHLPH